MEHRILLSSLSRLPDAELILGVRTLLTRERAVTAELIAHLAEMDTRDVHLREGYTSLYVYCRDALGLSEWEAYNRIDVARAARRFPIILDMLEQGSVNLTTIRILAPHLTPQNHLDVLDSARGRKKAEVEEIVARLAPRPDARSFVRLVRPSAPSSGATVIPRESPGIIQDLSVAPASDGSLSEIIASTSSQPTRATVQPLAPDRYKLQVTISGVIVEKLQLARDMLGHAVPSGDDAVILDRALTALLAELARKKFAETSKPRASVGTKRETRSPSAAVKRAVWLRDLGRCAFIAKSGHRCGERRFVEFHHVDPYALGGEATVDFIQLRCRRHNDYEGRLYFGKRRRTRELVPEQVGLSPSGST